MKKILIDITGSIKRQVMALDNLINNFNLFNNPLAEATYWFCGLEADNSLQDIWYGDLCFEIYTDENGKIKLSEWFHIADNEGNLVQTDFKFAEWR